jgi:hypothetical protein
MKSVLFGLFVYSLAVPAGLTVAPAPALKADKPLKVAVACFFQYEQTSGFNKICFYDCLGSTEAITIKATQLCPLTINR